MNKKTKLTIIIFSIIVLFLFGKKIFKSDLKSDKLEKNSTQPQIAKVLVKKVKPFKIDANVEMSGYIDAKYTITIVSQTDGIVKDILVSQGQKVNEGEIIIEVDEKDKLTDLKRAEQLLIQKKKELAISDNLLKTGDTPLTSNNQVKTAFQDAVTQLEKAKNQLNFTKIKANISGYVDKIDVKKGDHIDGKTSIAKIFDDKNFIAIVSIPQSKIQMIDVGQNAKILIDDKEFNGSVNFISNIADLQTKNYYSEINLNLSDKDKNFIVKMLHSPAQIKISYKELPAIQLSDSATYLNDDGYLTLKILNSDKIVSSIPVELLSSDKSGNSWFYSEKFNNKNEIEVITRGGGFISDGDKIESIEYTN